MDGHIDNGISGQNVLIIEETGRYATVTAFIDGLWVVKRKPIVTTSLDYDNPDTGQVAILIGHQWVENNLL